jgi:GntR family transcriptional regulator
MIARRSEGTQMLFSCYGHGVASRTRERVTARRTRASRPIEFWIPIKKRLAIRSYCIHAMESVEVEPMLLNISQHSEQTLQEQIIGQIRTRILRGELEPDQALTSIRALSKGLRVGVNTVQRAYEHLLREGLIYARSGKGFFVAPLQPNDLAEMARQRFTDSLKALIAEARREGVGNKEMKQILGQLQTGAEDGDA